MECYTSIATAALPSADLPVELCLALPAVPSSAMPGKCCKCNATGTCQNCACAKSGTGCTSCIPGLKNRCKNGGTRAPFQEQASSTGLSANCGAIRYPASQPVPQSVHDNNSAFPPRPMGISASQPAVSGIASNATPGAEDNISVAAVAANSTDDHPINLIDVTTNNASDHDKFVMSISAAYEEVIGWRRNLFIVPFGSTGEGFVNELSKLISAFADGSELRSIAWKAVSVLPHLLLQKSSWSRILSNNSTHLSRRLLVKDWPH